MKDYVLIADNNSSFRYFMQELLNYFGYVTKIARDGFECLQIVSSLHKPSLILLDNQMPELTGLEVLKLIKRRRDTNIIPVIAIISDEDLEQKLLNQGASAVLMKPFDIMQLHETIQSCLK